MAVKALIKESYHHGDLENALIAAAIELVRRDGPDHLSLRAVSSAVGVSPSASYHYFADKQALVSAMGGVLFNQLADMQEKAMSKVTGKGADAALRKFEAMGYSYFEWATKQPNLYRLIFGGFCEHKLNSDGDKAAQLLRDGLDELLAHGIINKSVRANGEMIVWSAIHGASSLAIEGLIPEETFPEIIHSIERSLGINSR